MHIALIPSSVFMSDSKYIILFLIASHLTLLKAHQRQGYVQYCLSGDLYFDNSSDNPVINQNVDFPHKVSRYYVSKTNACFSRQSSPIYTA